MYVTSSLNMHMLLFEIIFQFLICYSLQILLQPLLLFIVVPLYLLLHFVYFLKFVGYNYILLSIHAYIFVGLKIMLYLFRLSHHYRASCCIRQRKCSFTIIIDVDLYYKIFNNELIGTLDYYNLGVNDVIF